ncbi:MAG: peptidoglycan-binding protein [Candidatus Omnitrophica bacterium]|nr:peptidoglycan-binding protein [Candidatus Omnitrophota bacterium]MBI2496323.1 peptidoglycan-binding protein [Candidatus Omnitrophota bacterium]
MGNGRLLGLLGCAVLLGGCAGGRARQELARLQTQVGLLDERVTQLERSTSAEAGSMAAPSEGVVESPTAVEQPAQPRKSSSMGKSAVAKSSLKPSTRQIQQALQNAGFYQGPVDGKMGALTREAIREFQRVHGLNEDGVVGKQTWAKLSAYEDLSASSGEATAAEVLK